MTKRIEVYLYLPHREDPLDKPNRRVRLALPPDGSPTIEAPSESCHHCDVAPLVVTGTERRIGGHDYYEAKAHCIACTRQVGTLRAYVPTIFGLEEDERVLNGRCRVYGRG